MLQRILPQAIRSYSTAVVPSLELDLRTALKLSMKARDSFRTTVIKSILADLQTASHTPSPPSPLKTLARSIAIRKDSATTFLAANRADLSESYLKEVTILEEFSPSSDSAGGAMSKEDLLIEVKKVTQSLGLGDSLGLKDLGNVMKLVIKAVEGKVDNKEISEAVKSLVK